MVIDFGIAKATTHQRLTDRTLFTAFEMLIGTPAYMSPGQADLRTRAKTTSDFGAESPSSPACAAAVAAGRRPSPIGWERENRPPSVGVSNRFGSCERRGSLFPLPSDGRGSG